MNNPKAKELANLRQEGFEAVLPPCSTMFITQDHNDKIFIRQHAMVGFTLVVCVSLHYITALRVQKSTKRCMGLAPPRRRVRI